MPRLEDGTWVSDRQAAYRNELLQLEDQIPRAPAREQVRMIRHVDKLRKKIRRKT